jgi:hypothetical protein
VNKSAKYEGIVQFDRKTVLTATKSELICLVLHELAHSDQEALKHLDMEEYLRFYITEMFGKHALKEISWGHGTAWKKAYRNLVNRYKWLFPGVLKNKDVKEYGY